MLTIAGSKVPEQLTDFPVYIDLTQDDFKTRLDAAQLSFKRRMGANIDNLPYELQSFDPATGRLRAWVLLPRLSNGGDTSFELQYGDPAVAAAPNAPEVWRNGYRLVFHLESDTAIADSRQKATGTPSNLKPTALTDAKLGKGIDFDGNLNEWISFTNPINGGGQGTISVWVSQQDANNKEALVALGAGLGNQARWIYGSHNGNNQVTLGLFADDWTNTGLDIRNDGWRLIHWTYNNRTSRLYRDAQPIGNPFTHINNANTQTNQGWLGNNKSPGFDTDAGLNGILDEVRISDTARSPGWIAAEFANQSNPGTFLAASAPQPLP